MDDPRQLVVRVSELLLLLVVISLVAGQFLGQPILLGFVETESMAPTLSPGDGFVAVPPGLLGTPEVGDVVVYRAEVIEGGGLTTHRIVGETDRGYVTRGDANPFTDQDDGEPPVQDARVVAEVLQIGGNVVGIPHFGTVVEAVGEALTFVQVRLAGLFGTRSVIGTGGLAYLLFGTTAVYYLVGEYRDRNRKPEDSRSRERNESGVNPRLVLGIFVGVLIVAATASMAAPAGTYPYDIVSAEFESERADVIRVGESTSLNYQVPNSGLLPVTVFLEPGSDQIDVSDSELHPGPRETLDTSVTITAPDETGSYRYYVTEHRYLAVLPTSTIRTLYEIHPWLPVVVIDATIAGAFLALTLPFVGSGRIRDRSRDGASRSLLTRLVR